jgi:transcriptional regulatory protein RtcR
MTMSKSKKTVVIGLLGPTLDKGFNPRRWERWRPTVDLCRHEDMLIDRFEMLYMPRFEDLADQVIEDMHSQSPDTEILAHEFVTADPWDFQQVYAALHDFASNYSFDTEREEYLLHITTGTHVAQICCFLLAETRRIPARLLQASPPRGRDKAAPGTYRIIDLDLSRYGQIASRFEAEQQTGQEVLKAGIETKNRAFNERIERLETVAVASRAPILLMGPTGAGKTRLARRIYELKRSRNQVEGEFIEVNCATLRGDMAMSTLFGHKKGSFTGATRDRVGLLARADRGLLFLDEIGELGADEQAMLLKALEDKRFSPLGAEKEVESDFQLIAGTNRDLDQSVREGKFRDDLLARIDLWNFELPALRERPEDIEPNLDFELERWAQRSGARVRFSTEARRHFLRFATSSEASWPGNFRDFSAAIERMCTLAGGRQIGLKLTKLEIEGLRHRWAKVGGAGAGPDPLEGLLDAETRAGVDLYELAGLREAVRVCREARSLSDAGRRLFAVSRTRKKSQNDADRIRKILARHGLDWHDLRS